MKNILVPTDFSQQSLEVVHQLVKKQPYRKVNIFLVHLIHIPTDISDLLFIKKNRYYDLVPYQFLCSIDLLKNTYPAHINTLRLEFYYGDNYGVVESIIENLQVDEVCLLDEYEYATPLEDSVNSIALFNRCQVPVNKVKLPVELDSAAGANKTYSFFTKENKTAITS